MPQILDVQREQLPTRPKPVRHRRGQGTEMHDGKVHTHETGRRYTRRSTSRRTDEEGVWLDGVVRSIVAHK